MQDMMRGMGMEIDDDMGNEDDDMKKIYKELGVNENYEE
jgi:hypothetical protein